MFSDSYKLLKSVGYMNHLVKQISLMASLPPISVVDQPLSLVWKQLLLKKSGSTVKNVGCNTLFARHTYETPWKIKPQKVSLWTIRQGYINTKHKATRCNFIHTN